MFTVLLMARLSSDQLTPRCRFPPRKSCSRTPNGGNDRSAERNWTRHSANAPCRFQCMAAPLLIGKQTICLHKLKSTTSCLKFVVLHTQQVPEGEKSRVYIWEREVLLLMEELRKGSSSEFPPCFLALFLRLHLAVDGVFHH